jgi:hypothetical protein
MGLEFFIKLPVDKCGEELFKRSLVMCVYHRLMGGQRDFSKKNEMLWNMFIFILIMGLQSTARGLHAAR